MADLGLTILLLVASDFWDMSDSDDSLDTQQRITLHHGGAAMRAEFERKTRVANDIQKAIKRKEKDVYNGTTWRPIPAALEQPKVHL